MLAFSCGARSASELKVQGYLRSMLSRRQLQGFVGLYCEHLIFGGLQQSCNNET